jgi:DNA-binding transcriptional LysR family regulator
MMTDTTDLDIFARVARTGNMSAAGREMNLSPAVVSKRVGILEARLGVRLFQRTTRQLTLTDIGEGYFRRVVDILNLYQEAEDFVGRRNTRPRGVLKVTAPTTFTRRHIVPHLARFLELYPGIEIDLDVRDEMVDLIRDGFDLAIRLGELKDSSLIARRLARLDRVLVASPAYLHRAGEPKALRDLMQHDCLAIAGHDHWALEGNDGARTIRVKSRLRCNGQDALFEGVTAGLGIGFLPVPDVLEALGDEQLIQVLPKWRGSSHYGVHAVYASRDFLPSKVSLFIDHFANLYGEGKYWTGDQPLAQAA